FAQPNYTVAEGDPVTINVTRTGGTAAASINYATLDGSASSPADYTGTAAGVLNFDAGQTTASFTVTALSDLSLESPETVNLVLFGGNVSNPSILTINDVPPPTRFFFSQDTYSVIEDENALITINRSGDLSQPSEIFFGTADDTAQSRIMPSDYIPVFQQIIFEPGETSVQVPVQTLFDGFAEFSETVDLVLIGSSVDSPVRGVLTIIDRESMFGRQASFFDGSSRDPITDGGSGDFTTLNRTGNTSLSASEDYLIAPRGGQPVNNVGYNISPFAVNPSGGTVNINPGQTPVSLTNNNLPDLTGGVGNSGLDPGSIGRPASTKITLI
ncbi:Calx-beta domain-containing protein, partial [Microcoleus sp. D2_18a_B4]|uniref:Calx-beta domain-containing protein n=1 Tax=Microcoleus sp. D2_18a_B4 TaxID=3055329 RepID=UPI002FCE7948